MTFPISPVNLSLHEKAKLPDGTRQPYYSIALLAAILSQYEMGKNILVTDVDFFGAKASYNVLWHGQETHDIFQYGFERFLAAGSHIILLCLFA
ncbi:hypothetical protein CF326_g1369 [Tilletia indica]|uniref:Uncharacterized protein n=1 Tax=Tilletia indica TaxID=43049 RepID=A0A8T8SL16_9BASI|nr:hypothetical protein CF326_g1369 [Tilletia indica]KAE8241940.1 hypothetical protein A4X13_0g7196 [Tilletia indica]